VTATTFSTAGTADLLAIYSSKNNNKKHKANDNKKISSPATGNNNTSTPSWSVPYNPWTGVIQA
jgi:hypothetical protein